MSDFGVKITDQGPKLDTSALRSAGKALLAGTGSSTPAESTLATPASPASPATTASVPIQSSVTVTPVEQPAAAAETPAAPVDNPATTAAPKFVDLPDDQMVKVTVNGEEQVLPWGEARKQLMLHRTFTQKSQQLAQERKQIEERSQQISALEQKASRAEKLERLVTTPDLFAQYAIANPVMARALAARFGTTVAQATAGAAPAAQVAVAQAASAVGVNNDELANLGEVNSIVGSRMGEIEQRFGQTLEQRAEVILGKVNEVVDQKLAELRDAHEVSQFNTQIAKTIKDNLDTNPALKAIPRIEELIRFEVGQMQPESVEEMLEAINVVSKGIVEGLQETYNQSRSAQLIAREKLVKEGIEPPVGAPVNNLVKKEENFVLPGGKMNWKALAAKGKAVIGS
jgi:hypothetical protein